MIYNSTTLDCTRKFRDFFLVGMALQRLSDQICLEHGLSVIKPRRYDEREKRTDYPWRKTKRSTVCEDIDIALAKGPKDFAELLKFLAEAGYEIKPGANPSIRGKDQKRFIRFRSLGEGYTVADLEKIISGEMQQNPKNAKWKNKENKRRSFDLLVDIQKKLREGKGAGYERWAKVFNLKQISQALLFLEENGVRDYETLAEKADISSKHFNELSERIKASEKRLSEIAELRKHIINYSKTKVILMGRLTRDPEIRRTGEDNSTVVARYTLAVDRRVKKEGDNNADFINCVVFGKGAEVAENYLGKGIKIAVTGRIQTGSYTNKDGNKVYTTDVVVEEQEFCESKNSQGAPAGPSPDDGFMNIPDDLDGELPFV